MVPAGALQQDRLTGGWFREGYFKLQINHPSLHASSNSTEFENEIEGKLQSSGWAAILTRHARDMSERARF